jgi:hypothetical protein
MALVARPRSRKINGTSTGSRRGTLRGVVAVSVAARCSWVVLARCLVFVMVAGGDFAGPGPGFPPQAEI